LGDGSDDYTVLSVNTSTGDVVLNGTFGADKVETLQMIAASTVTVDGNGIENPLSYVGNTFEGSGSKFDFDDDIFSGGTEIILDNGFEIQVNTGDTSNQHSKLFFKENHSRTTYGFSQIYAASSNPTIGGISFTLSGNTWNLIRHNNSSTGSVVMSAGRSGGLTINENTTFGGEIKPATIADASASNNSIYYSSTQSKLAYKDSGGTVHNLY